MRPFLMEEGSNMTTVISFGCSDEWMRTIWPYIRCSADRIIVELNDLDAYDSMSLSEKEELCRPACPDFEASLKSIQALIGEFYLSAFHATRALSSDSFIVNGLRVLDDKRLRELADDIRISINHPQFSFEDYEIPENRKGKAWLALTDPTKEPSGFKEFMCCFGGEVLGEFLRGSGLDCDVIARIRSLGSPLCVECHIPINSIGNCKVAEIVKDMIKHALNVKRGQFYNLDRPYLKLVQDIPPQYIHEVRSVSVNCETQ